MPAAASLDHARCTARLSPAAGDASWLTGQKSRVVRYLQRVAVGCVHGVFTRSPSSPCPSHAIPAVVLSRRRSRAALACAGRPWLRHFTKASPRGPSRPKTVLVRPNSARSTSRSAVVIGQAAARPNQLAAPREPSTTPATGEASAPVCRWQFSCW